MLNFFSKKNNKNNKYVQAEKIINTFFNDLLTLDETKEREDFEREFKEKNEKNNNLKKINEIREKMKKDTIN